jgi:hypothetical protein
LSEGVDLKLDQQMDSNTKSCDWAAKAGRLVVCVNDDFSNAPPHVRIAFTFPIKGNIYTLREVLTAAGKPTSFLLAEIVNPVVKWPSRFNNAVCEISFFHWRFEPLFKIAKPLTREELQWISRMSNTGMLRGKTATIPQIEQQENPPEVAVRLRSMVSLKPSCSYYLNPQSAVKRQSNYSVESIS